MKKNLLRFSIFTAIFVLLLSSLSFVFSVKPPDSIKLRQFYNEPKNSYDVLIFGTSTARGAILPPVLWEEAGIASFNLSTSSAPSATQYYWLKESLKYQSPSVVFIHGNFLFRNEAINNNREPLFRQNLDPMRLSLNKLVSVYDVVSNDREQTFISYLFPLFRYHDRQKFGKSDFDVSVQFERNLRLGYSATKGYTRISPQERPVELDDENYDPDFIYNDIYLSKMIDLCKANDIEVIIAVFPAYREDNWSMHKHRILKKYAEEKGAALIDFFYGEPRAAVSLDDSADFYDVNHVNINGATKITRYLARYLDENHELPDRKAESSDPHWDVVMDTYHELYDVYLDTSRG